MPLVLLNFSDRWQTNQSLGFSRPVTAVRRVINAASVRTNTCPSAQESTAVDKACHDPMGGEFGSTTRSVANLKGFKIASMNVNSLLKHIDEIRHVSLSAPFDIFAINESKSDELISDNEISIPGYSLIRKDRNRAGGGVVLYIRENI